MMATRAELIAQLNDTVPRVLQVESVASDADLVESGLLDSFGLVNLLFTLEEQFGITITLKDLDAFSFRSVEGMAAFLERRLA